MKNSTVSQKTKASHLAYIGDANIEEGVNIGAGVVVANYDGSKKHKTLIKKYSFIGSNVTLIAPLTLGKSSKVAAGSVITENISDSQIAFARSRQTNKDRKKGGASKVTTASVIPNNVSNSQIVFVPHKQTSKNRKK